MFEQMKGLTPKKKIEYYIEYYGLITVGIIAAVIAVVSFVVQQVRAKEEVAGVMVINSLSTMNEESREQEYMDGLLESLGIDTAKNTIMINDNIFVGENADVQMAAAGVQIIQALIMSRTADVAFVDESYCAALVSSECFGDLRDYLDAAVLEKHADDILYCRDSETGEDIAAVIKIPADSPWMQGMGWYAADCYAGIIVATENGEIAEHMLLRALGEEEF